MKAHEILASKDHFYQLVSANRFQEAFSWLTGISESMMVWEISEKIKNAERNYRLMLDYAMQGAKDEKRDFFIEKTAEDLLTLFNLLVIRQKLVENKYEIFLDKYRISQQYGIAVVDLLDTYIADKERLESSWEDRLKSETAIFYALWTGLLFTENDRRHLLDFFISKDASPSVRNLILGALLMHCVSVGYSSEILKTLFNIYDLCEIEEWHIKALTVAVLLIFMFREHISPSFMTELVSPISNKFHDRWDKDLQAVIIELLRTRETEAINKKMNDEIIPAMMKMGPQMRDRFRILDEEDLQALEENPQWKEIFEKSGLGKHLEELNRMQIEGADVMMSSFGQLKSFPFFQSVHNWFLPFNVNWPLVKDILKDSPALNNIVGTSTVLCDSDIYSFIFTFNQLPHEQREKTLELLNEQFKAMAEMRKYAETADARRIANRYVKDLYRFFKLFRRKEEFTDPFNYVVNPLDIKRFLPNVESKEMLEVLSELYFKYKIWDQAIRIFKALENHGEISEQLYQKLGYCYQKNGNFEEALNFYSHAEVLATSDDEWTMRKIAMCARVLGKWTLAAEYYKKLLDRHPDDFKYSYALGNCFMEERNFKEAAKYFYQAHYLDSESVKALRALAECLLATGDFEKAHAQIDKLLSTEKDGRNNLLLGDYYILTGHYDKAVDEYRNTATVMGMNRDDVFNHLMNHRLFGTLDSEAKKMVKLVTEKLRYEI